MQEAPGSSPGGAVHTGIAAGGRETHRALIVACPDVSGDGGAFFPIALVAPGRLRCLRRNADKREGDGIPLPRGDGPTGRMAGAPYPYRDSPLPVGKTGARPAPDRCSLKAASSSPMSWSSISRVSVSSCS